MIWETVDTEHISGSFMNQWYRILLLKGVAFRERSVKECALCAHSEKSITAAASTEDQEFLHKLLGRQKASLLNSL